MNRALPLVAILLLFAGCAPAVKSLSLADINLDDPHAVSQIGSQLSEADRAALATYIVRHRAGGRHFCGRPLLRSDGRTAQTVGEAIQLTVAREREQREADAKLREPGTSHGRARERWDDLASQRDTLLDAQSRLREQSGSAAEQTAEWKRLADRLADIDARLERLRPVVFGS